MSTSNPDQSRGPAGQLLASLRGLVATAIETGRTRLELLTVEVQEELHRTARMLLLGLIAVLAASAGVLFAGLTVIFAFWDTHRILASALVTGAFLLVAAIAAFQVRSRLASRPPFLQGTLAELVQDEGRLRDGSP